MFLEPLVTVLFPINRIDSFSLPALNSILTQTYRNLEILILDSTISTNVLTEESFYKLAAKDDRCFIHNLPDDNNLSQNLNFGISIASGDFIARMDADDISKENRIEYQMNHLRANPDISVLGTGIEIIGELTGHKLQSGMVLIPPTRKEDLLKYCLRGNPMYHPTVIFRKQILDNFKYDARFNLCQDYEMWTRLLRNSSLDNLEIPLLLYRLHPNQSGVTRGKDSEYFSSIVRLRHSFWMLSQFREVGLSLKVVVESIVRILRSKRSILLKSLH